MMRGLWLALLGLVVAIVVLFVGAEILFERVVVEPSGKPSQMAELESNSLLNTVNTTRVGSDDPVETAVAVSQIIYPVTEEENRPGAIVLVNRHNLPEVLVAASRVQHFPVNAPLLYVEEDSIPSLTRSELLRLKPEGVPFDGNTQVYLVGTITESVRRKVESLGYTTRTLSAPDPVALAEIVDNWTSTQHGDHENKVIIANLDRPEAAIPAAFWSAHAGDGFAFVTDQGIPEATQRILSRRANGPWLYVFGDESIVPETVVRQLGQIGHVTRIPRSDLPGISAFFAGHHDSGEDWDAWVVQGARSFGWGNAEAGRNAIFVNVDGPGGWQNALVATTLSHMGKHAPVLVVSRDRVPQSVVNYLELLKPYPTAPRQQLLDHGWVIGGEETISWPTQAALDLMLEAKLSSEVKQGTGTAPGRLP